MHTTSCFTEPGGMSRDFSHHQRNFRRLAEVLLKGEWSQSGLVASLEAARDGHRGKWPAQLASAVWQQFGRRFLPPLQRELVDFLAKSGIARRISKRRRSSDGTTIVERMDPVRVPVAAMDAVPDIPWASELPQIRSASELAGWFGITCGELDWFASLQWRQLDRIPEKLRHYRCRWRSRRGRRPRLIEAPKSRLKELQRLLLDNVLARIQVHPAAGAFRRGVSLIDCLRPHSGKRFVMKLDINDFFPSIPYSLAMGLFRTVGFPETVARLLAGICTHATPSDVLDAGIDRLRESTRWHRFRSRHLPQGAPTSPLLANLCAFHLDRRLTGLANKFEATYTRYADDLIFSGERDFERSQSRFRTWALAILIDEGFTIQQRKTRCMPAGGSQRVCGLKLNEKPNIDRCEFDQLKAILFNCTRFGPASQNRDRIPRFREHLLGRIAWVSQVNPKRGAKLARLFDRIEW